MKIFNRFVKPLCRCKARKIADHCRKFLQGKIIDVGAGRCYIAEEIQTRYNSDISCIDIADLNETNMHLTVYDGKRIPYKNSEFDTALLVYVLHHCEDPVRTLKECIRVVKRNGKIIIFEDFGFVFVTYALDWISNKLHNVAAPLHFKTEEEWKSIFSSLGLKIIHIEHGVERQFFYPFTEHKMFVLEVEK